MTGLEIMLVLALQAPKPTVTVIQGEQQTTVRVVDARNEYRRLRAQETWTVAQQARLTALANALGTLPGDNPMICIGSRCEVFRGRRIATQAVPR